MNTSKRYSSELRNRAVQMAVEHSEWNPHGGPSADGDVELVP